MGSYSEPRNKGIDTTAGALVWVRRRNGSWWPGLVMPLEGLPRRRRGTPVKLLGKEDGSMDWYDLEKSKRIKAFRCGEYEECIRNAKASAQCSHKADRMGKYARREDAIIHALELERVHDSNGNWEFYSGLIQLISQKGQQGLPKEKTSIKKKSTKVKDESPQSVNSSEYHKTTIADKVQAAKKRKWRTLSDNLGGVKDVTHMRGDLGVKCERASAITGSVRCCDLDLVDDLSITDTNFNSTFLRSSPLHHMKYIYSAKRGQRETHLNEVSKRKNRRRPITKVLESTSRVILPSFNSQEGSPGPTGQSSLLEAVQSKFANFDSSESKKTEFSVVINNSSEYSENSCADVSGVLEVTKDIVVDRTCFSYSNELSSAFVAAADGFFGDLFDVPVLLEENYNGDYYHAISSPTSKDVCRVMVGSEPNHIEAAATSSERNLGAANVGDERQKGKRGNSRQHLKGRTLTRATGPNEDAFDTADISKSLLSTCDVASSSRIEGKIEEISWSRLLELNDSIQLMSCGLFPSKRSHQSLKQTHEIPDVACTYPIHSCKTKELVYCSDTTSQYGPGECNRANDLYKDSSSLKFLDESLAEDMGPRQNLNAMSTVPGSSILYDVKVGLQETDKDAHVPSVSLRNKAICKAIVGHPIPVQIVESDYLDSLMLSRGFCVAIDVSDKHSRTSMSEEPINNAAAPFLLENKKEYKVRGNSKSHRKYKKRDPDYHRTPSSSRMKTSQVKRLKVLPRKIRKLSSITVDRGEKDTLGEHMVGKLVACVPAKLVFRRITEALGCLPQQDGHA